MVRIKMRCKRVVMSLVEFNVVKKKVTPSSVRNNDVGKMLATLPIFGFSIKGETKKTNKRDSEQPRV